MNVWWVSACVEVQVAGGCPLHPGFVPDEGMYGTPADLLTQSQSHLRVLMNQYIASVVNPASPQKNKYP